MSSNDVVPKFLWTINKYLDTHNPVMRNLLISRWYTFSVVRIRYIVVSCLDLVLLNFQLSSLLKEHRPPQDCTLFGRTLPHPKGGDLYKCGPVPPTDTFQNITDKDGITLPTLFYDLRYRLYNYTYPYKIYKRICWRLTFIKRSVQTKQTHVCESKNTSDSLVS